MLIFQLELNFTRQIKKLTHISEPEEGIDTAARSGYTPNASAKS